MGCEEVTAGEDGSSFLHSVLHLTVLLAPEGSMFKVILVDDNGERGPEAATSMAMNEDDKSTLCMQIDGTSRSSFGLASRRVMN